MNKTYIHKINILFVFFICTPFFLSQQIQATGGVDVGNAREVNYNLKNFSSEKDLQKSLKSLRASIISQKDKKVNRWIQAGACNPQRIQVDYLQVQSFYKYSPSSQQLQKKYTGNLKIKLFQCAHPTLIKDDKLRPYGNY